MRLTWPLAGRSEEMRSIGVAISAPDSSGVLLRGAAGIGKSRVAREALALASANGREVRWVVATSSARALPLGAFTQWAGTADVEGLALVRVVIDALTATSTGTPAVIGVDDVHLLDDLSAFVLHQIVARRGAKLVLTLREDEPVPPSVREIWNSGEFERLDLQPLSQDETTSLVSTALEGPLEPDTARRLWRLTHGNVLYLRNIVEREIADHRLERQQGFWAWRGEPVVPPDLADMIESRIGTLPPPVGDVLDTLAVGEPIELASLNRITDPAAVEEADTRGLITFDRGAGSVVEVRIAHPLYGEVRRKRASALRLRRLRGRVAAELATRSDKDMRMVVRRATLTLDSDLDQDPDLFVRAAQGAVWLADLPLADRLTDAAIGVGGSIEAIFVRAHVLGWLGRSREADAVLADCPTAGLTDSDRARLAFLRANNMLWGLGDPEAAKQVIDQAASDIPAESHECLNAFLTVYWSALGSGQNSLRASKGIVLERLPGIVCAETAAALVGMYGHCGRIDDAVAAADPGYAIVARSFDTPHMRAIISDNHVRVLLLAGRIAEARDIATELCESSADLPGIAPLLSAAVAGRAALGAGNLDIACTQLQPAAELLSASGAPAGVGYVYRLSYAIALAMRGLADQAVNVLEALTKARNASRSYLDYEWALARAFVAAAQGCVTDAVGISLSQAEEAGNDGQFATEVILLQAATQFGDSSAAARLHELTAIVEGPRVAIAARFAAALAAGDGAELAAVSVEFESMGDRVAAMDAAAHAAAAYRRADMNGSALTCSARAEQLARRCGGASSPALLKASKPLPLTDRELEIAMMIGRGLPTRLIAERLTLSVRTVEGHIYRAMAKTGAEDRDQLARMVPREGP